MFLFRPHSHGFDVFFGLPYSNDSTAWAVGEKFTQVMGLEPLPLIEDSRAIEAPVDQSTLTRRDTTSARFSFFASATTGPSFSISRIPCPMFHNTPRPISRASRRRDSDSDVVEELDWGRIGVIFDTLRELKIEERHACDFHIRQRCDAPPSSRSRQGKSQNAVRGPFLRPQSCRQQRPPCAGKGTTFEGGLRVPASPGGPKPSPRVARSMLPSPCSISFQPSPP